MNRLSSVLLLVFLAACSSSTPAGPDLESGADAVADLARPADVVRFPDLPDVGVELPLAPVDVADTQAPDGFVSACQPGEGCFLDACLENAECQSSWCVQHLGAGVCSMPCQDECPAGWTCRQVAGTDPDVVYICVSDYPTLCRPCTTGADCGGLAGTQEACLDYGADGRFCGGACGPDEACPWGFTCKDSVTQDGVALRQCVADTGLCPCTQASIANGLATPCSQSNEFGTCPGKRTCSADGLTACDAPVPGPEACNGVDDDCDGETDEPDLVTGEYVALCDDDNDCTADSCLGADGCVNEALSETECSDGDPCTVADHCEEGTCVGDAVVCDDENPCTQDLCTAAGGCEHPPQGGECDDADPCTLGDHCQDGQCGGESVDCHCLADADCESLEDGDLCNGTLVCDTSAVPYRCVVDPDTVVICAAPEGIDAPCLEAVCDGETGNCSFQPANDGAPCADGDACTLGDTCSEGICSGGPAVNCNDANPCTDDACEPDAGCTYADNAAPCSDGDVCTAGDACAGGACVPGDALGCDDGNPCTDDACDPGVGCVHSSNAAACDDGNSCTTQDVCSGGQCTAGVAVDCDDDDPCTTDSCQPAGGCVHTLNEAPCNDDDLCTTNDHCHLGECIGAGQLGCDDANPCTTDSCHALLGCQFEANTEPCDDENACTVADQCSQGWCKPGPPLTCDDDNPCTEDTCAPASGCAHTPNAAPCDDGDACTGGDTCANGACEAGVPVVCDDANECTVDSCDPATGCVAEPVVDGTECGGGFPYACAAGVCVCHPQCAGKACGDDACGGECGVCAEGELCQEGACVPACQPIVYGYAGLGEHNGWTCTDVCAQVDGTSVDWDGAAEQEDYCHELHPDATIFVKSPNNFSYPIYEPQNHQCKINQDGQKSQNFAANGTPQYGDQILCKCQKSCPCPVDCGDDAVCLEGACVPVNCAPGYEPTLGGPTGRSWWQSSNCSGTEYIEPPPFPPPWRATPTPLCKATGGTNFSVKSTRTSAQCQSTNASASTIWLEVTNPL